MHTYFTYFIKGVASCGVPLFFMVNGAVMLNKSFDIKKHIKKIIATVILTILWAIISLLLLIPIKGEYLSIVGLIKALWSWKLGWINHLWFLQSLICIYIIFPLIKVTYDKDKKNIYFFLVVTFILTFGNTLINMLANIAQWLLTIKVTTFINFNFFNGFNPLKGFYGYILVYFILGGLIQKHIKQINKRISIKLIITISIISMMLLFLYGLFMCNFTNEIYDTVWNGYDTIMILIVSCSIFILSTRVTINNIYISKIITIIGMNTLGIYFVHIFIGSVFKPYFILLSLSQNVFISLFFGLVVMGVSLYLTLILKRFPLVRLLFKY